MTLMINRIRLKGWQLNMVALSLVLLMSSCEDFFISEVKNLKIPGSEPQLVVYSYISPQNTQLRVLIYRSVPYSLKPGDYIPVEGSADVFIAVKGEDFVKLEYDAERGYFSLPIEDFPVTENTRYLLKVETHDGDYTQAECYVPGYEIENPELTDIEEDQEWGNKIYRMKWRLTTKPGNQERYFRTGAFAFSYNIYKDEDGNLDTSRAFSRYVRLERGSWLFEDSEGGDYFYEGSYRIGGYSFYLDPDTGQPAYPHEHHYLTIDSVFLYATQTDYHYYRFHKSVNDYYYYGEDFPFAETVHIYTNMSNGLGVFGGFNRRTFFAAEIISEPSDNFFPWKED